jgi:predicted DNA-binding transcriptional regulator YafY
VLAAHVVKGSATKPDPALDAALHKLEALAADVAVHLPEPASLAPVRNGTAQAKTVRFRYLKPGAVEATEREVEPYKVFRKSGSWYLVCKDLRDEKIKFFRIDLMADAEMTHTEFHPPGDDVELPEELSFAHLLQHVTVEVPDRLRNLLEDDYAIDEITPAAGDRIRVRLGVLGDDRLDYLLLRLGADAEWDDPNLGARRADLAQRILAEYDQ